MSLRTHIPRLLAGILLTFVGLHLVPPGWDLLYAADARPYVSGGTVTRVAGHTAVTIGDRCTVLVDPDFKAGFNCRVDLVCGGKPLWGGILRGGYLDCVTRDDRFVRGEHRDPERDGGHVWLAFDLEAGSVTLDDRIGVVEIQVGVRPSAGGRL